MKIKLYQIAPERDDKNLMFMNYEWTVKHGGVHSGPYELVFDGEVDAKRLARFPACRSVTHLI